MNFNEIRRAAPKFRGRTKKSTIWDMLGIFIPFITLMESIGPEHYLAFLAAVILANTMGYTQGTWGEADDEPTCD